MPAPTIYRSTDASAPVLTGQVGALTTLLDTCLRTGYGAKSGAGWTTPYTSTNAAVFKQGTGSSGMYLQVDDNGGLTGGARDAGCYGFETMTAYATGTGQFPTAAQRATGVYVRKSSLADATARGWMLIADAATFYLFVLSGDATGAYVVSGFGDFYSFIAGDAYKVLTMLHDTTATTALATHLGGSVNYGIATGSTGTNAGQYLPRNFSAVGGSTASGRVGDSGLIPVSSNVAVNPVGTLYFPNQADGGLYLAPVRIVDGSTPGTTVAGSTDLRGRFRGLFHLVHPTANFADGDTFNGAEEYAGRTFMVVKPVLGTSAVSQWAVETTAWDTST